MPHKNPEKRKEYAKEWRLKNKEKILAYDNKGYSKIYRLENVEKIRAYTKRNLKRNYVYKKNNRAKINLHRRERWIKDIQFRLMSSLRARLRLAIKNNQKIGSAIHDLGCTIEELKIHLEKQFQEGMTWENHGLYGWHIDHIIALSSVDLTDKKQFLQVVHYTNLQPLWAKDNLEKRFLIDNKPRKKPVVVDI